MTEFNEAQVALFFELSGRKCRCGDPKQARQTFCVNCYYKLPSEVRVALYRRFGNGYEEAYAMAIDHLKSVGRVVEKPLTPQPDPA